jgi:hypothetical protein
LKILAASAHGLADAESIERENHGPCRQWYADFVIESEIFLPSTASAMTLTLVDRPVYLSMRHAAAGGETSRNAE